MSSAVCFNLDQSKILSSGNGYKDMCAKIILLDNIAIPFPKQALVFTCLQYMSFENTVGKEEIACNEQFLLFPQCFLPI